MVTAELSEWAEPKEDLPNLPCHCQTAYFAVALSVESIWSPEDVIVQSLTRPVEKRDVLEVRLWSQPLSKV